MYHNNPQDLRSSSSIKERTFIAENTDQIYFVSGWVKNKFFENLPYHHRNNCEILYPAINPIKKFPKKEKVIIFTGKLNSSKGFDIYGKSVIKILDKFKNWKAMAIGNEPREKFNFQHDRLKILDWVNHSKILNYYKKASISVVPSRWQEPFGRTAMESAAFGCATITSKKGGLPETFENSLFINKINEHELYTIIKKLIINESYRKKIQKINWKNVKHKLSDHVGKIDSLKNFYLNSNFNFNKGSKLKILHIS
ncbi:glycosyltransferase family 4 protein, partial [Candidatus Pelagibacter communis]|uniref:glycosyltransferase family 4 protein n=1 Tax=Pelagibacter ubique TaxID=198252 RepID=UPI001177FFA2